MRIAGCIVMMGLLLARPDITTQAARTALHTWGLDVVPSLFPYMVLCRLLCARLRGGRLPPAAVTAILGLAGGSPSGAAVLSDYARQSGLSSRSVQALCVLTGTISPMFTLSTLCRWLGDARLCQGLLAAHLLGAALCAVLACLLPPPARACAHASRAQEQEGGSVIAQSVQAILGVGGCIVFFSVVSSGVTALMPGLPPLASGTVHALLEIAGGLAAICRVSCPPAARSVLIAGLCGFSGLSILSQNALFLRPCGISMLRLTGLSLLRALCAALVMAALCPFLL